MKLILKKEGKEIDAKYFKIDALVRYWEDSEINGEDDVDINTNPSESPRMQFAVKENGDWLWKPIIELETGKIVGWKEGTTARICYKVCDAGIYSLLDNNMNELVSVSSYVPYCIGTYGDYIEFYINEKGNIENFKFTQEDLDEMVQNDFNNDQNF